jgi:hypothetical protein
MKLLMSASTQLAVLPLPVVLLKSANAPSAVFWMPVVLRKRANVPQAVLKVPVELSVAGVIKPDDPHAQRNPFHHRGVRQQSRLFARWNQSLRRFPNSNRIC